MANSLLINITRNKQVLGICGLGGTEGRILGFIWIGIIHFGGFSRSAVEPQFVLSWDAAAFAGVLALICKLGYDLTALIRQNSEEETKAWALKGANMNVAGNSVTPVFHPQVNVVDLPPVATAIPVRPTQRVARRRSRL
jgi:hypothetical protein